MARSRQKPVRRYTETEKEYIRRVAGKVPLPVMANALNRPKHTVQKWANEHGISLRVPYRVMIKHWREYVPKHQVAECC